ncbi:MAG: YibE/F family protein [Deferribacteraceae bacterium]|jgi:uncharacterized membrane protein|nr:YibE/F family protein [Deferribacteraceae bacterium]
MKNRFKAVKKDLIFTCTVALVTIALFLLPTGFRSSAYEGTVRVKAMVIETDDSMVRQFGIVKQGVQNIKARVLSGKFKGEICEASNNIVGKMEVDKVFAPGDKILMGLTLDENGSAVISSVAFDYYRINTAIILFVVFAGTLLFFAGFTGLKSLLSFLLSVAVFWKVFIPSILHGFLGALPIALLTTFFLTGCIMFLVGGLNKRGLVSFLGACAGIFLTFLLAVLFGAFFRVNGAVKPFTEILLYSGFPHLNITLIFLASIVISSSGAIMDVAMDIASALQEIREKAPGISLKELISSGFNVGRAVIGTMTTTLLLAYSGSYISLLMYFMAQGIPLENILNLSYVSAEILATLSGSIGIVAVAPFTAVIGGIIFKSGLGRSLRP